MTHDPAANDPDRSPEGAPTPSDPPPRAIDETLPFTPPGGSADMAPTVDSASPTDDDAPIDVPTHVGPFAIKGPLATGGMGAVFEAEQENPRRSVALKILRAEMSTPDVMRRFEYESQILAQLRHPGIAQIYDAGTFEHLGRRRPYYAMELVDGARTLRQYCDDEGLDLRARLRLFADICEAVHHGHQRGVIHRDLKPANILVDREGHPKIIDFGVARAVDAERHPTTSHTSLGQLLGTLQYMSPEQVSGDPTAVDIRTDVYALGVVLYELLTASFPYDIDGRAIYEATRVIREESPARPSTRVSTLRGDIETITLKALEKDKERRYASTHEFAQDVRRYLRGEPILARPPSLVYQLTMLARRYQVAAFAALVVTVVTVAGLLVTAWALLRALEERAESETEKTNAVIAKNEADLQRRAAERSAYRAAIAAADAALRNSDTRSARQYLWRAAERLRGWEWQYLAAQLEPERAAWIGHVAPVAEVAVSTDGALAVSADESGEVLVWSVADAPRGGTGQLRGPVARARHNGRAPIIFLDRTHFLTTTDRGQLGLFDAERRTLHSVPFRLDSELRTFAVDASGPWIALAENRMVTVWKLGEAAPRHTFDLPESVEAIAIEAPHLSIRGARGELWIRNLETDAWTTEDTSSPRFLPGAALAFDPRRPALADVTGELAITIRDPRNGTETRRLLGHTDRVTSVEYDPRGEWLASTSDDSSVRLWRAENGVPGPVLTGHRSATTAVAFTPDGKTVITGSADGTLRSWPIEPERVVGRPARFLRVSPDGRWEVRQTMFGLVVEIAPLIGGASTLAPMTWEPDQEVVDGLFSDDGRTIALALEDGAVHLARPGTAQLMNGIQFHPSPVRGLRFEPNGDWLLTVHADGQLAQVASETGELLAEFGGQIGPATGAVDVSPDGERLVVARSDGRVEQWRLANAAWTLGQTWSFEEPCDAVYYDDSGERLIGLFGAPGGRRDLVTWRSDAANLIERSLGTFRAEDLIPTPSRDRFVVSLREPARLLVISPEHEEPLLTISGHVSLAYRSAGFVRGRGLLVYDPLGTRAELATWDPELDRHRLRGSLETESDRLLERAIFTESAIVALREDRRLPAWAREVAYFRVVESGIGYDEHKRQLSTRLFEPTDEPRAAQAIAEDLRIARALVAFNPEDADAQRLHAIAHYRSGQFRSCLTILEQLPEDERNFTAEAFCALALQALDRPRDAQVHLRNASRQLLQNEAARFQLPGILNELNEKLGTTP